MKSGIRDKAEGTFHEVKGTIKKITGKAIHNRKLEVEGIGEEISGSMQVKIGQVKEVMGQ